MSNKSILQFNNETLSTNNLNLQNLIDQEANKIDTCEIQFDHGLQPSAWIYRLMLNNNIIKPHFELMWGSYDHADQVSYENTILNSYGILMLETADNSFQLIAKNISIIDTIKENIEYSYPTYVILYEVTPSVINYLNYNKDSITIETTIEDTV